MIIEYVCFQKDGAPVTRIVVWPFSAHDQYNWQAFVPKSKADLDVIVPGYPGCGYVDITVPGEWHSVSRYQRMRDILSAVSKSLGIGSNTPAQITELLPQEDVFDVLLGGNLDAQVQGWAWKNRRTQPLPGTYLWGIFFYPRHSSSACLKLDVTPGDPFVGLLDFFLLLGTGKIRFEGPPPFKDEDVLIFLKTVSPKTILRLPETLSSYLILWDMPDSLEYLYQAKGKVMWSDRDTSVIFKWNTTPETHPFITSILLTRGGSTMFDLSNVKLTGRIVDGLKSTARTSVQSNLCDRGNSLLSNPGILPFLSVLRGADGMRAQDLQALALLEELLTRPYSLSAITSCIKTMAGTNVSGRHRNSRGNTVSITLPLHHMLARGDIKPEGVGNVLLGLTNGTTLDSYLNGDYYYTRKKVEQAETPPLAVPDGVLHQLLRKPVRLGMIGEWLSDAGINIDTTPALQEMPVLVKMRLAKPKWPNGIEYWIKQMARDHDKREKEETSENA